MLRDKMFIPNGMGWDPGRSTYFVTDTIRHLIYAYDYEIETGAISNPRNLIEFTEEEFPDGMTIDSEGCFWVAMWGGSKVIRFDPEGKKVEEISLPVLHPTSCCFGGPGLKTLFITSSQIPLTEKQRIEYPLAGRLFSLETDTRGQVEPRFRG